MPNRSIVPNVLQKNLYQAEGAIADANTESVDVRGFDAVSLLFLIGSTVNAGFEIALEDSDDNTTFTAVDADYIIGDVTADSETAQQIGYVGGKRYLRAAMTIPGASDLSVAALLAYPSQAKVQ